ncbi:hypothetical protein FM106_11680 [Brachybacterium faecium]|nr:hypothetical protein FM106_11680 [Brachybacterium faecium]
MNTNNKRLFNKPTSYHYFKTNSKHSIIKFESHSLIRLVKIKKI